MSHSLSLSELARQIEENQRQLLRALRDAGMADTANFLALLIDSCLKFLAVKGELIRELNDLENKLSNRDSIVRQLTLKLEAGTAEQEKLCQQLSEQEACSGGSAERSLKDRLDDIEQVEQQGLNLAERQVRLLTLIRQQQQLAQENRNLLRRMIAEDKALIDGLKKLKEEDDADTG